MSRSRRRRLRATLLLATSLALLGLAPGALASTLTVDSSGNLVYTATAGHVTAIELDQQPAPTTTVVVHEDISGDNLGFGSQNFGPFTDTDPITTSGNCTNDANSDSTPDTDTDGNPIFTCTGVTGSALVDTLDGNDAVDASGVLTGESQAGLVTIPLVANLGDDDDVAVGGKANDVIHGNAGDDAIAGDQGGPSGGDDHLFGDDGSDGVAGGSGNDTLDGGAGDDQAVVGGPGDDTISGGDGNDGFVAGGPGNDTVDGGNGNDQVFGDCGGSCGGGNTFGNDTVNGGAGDDFVRGEQGNDIVNGGAGNDNGAGGPGTDTLDGGDGTDFLQGGPGNDNVGGGAGDDTLSGDCNAYNDCGNGTDGNDVVHGDAGDDMLTPDGGADTYAGGTGIDQIAYTNEICDGTGCHAAATNVTLDDAANDGHSGEGDNVGSDVEDVYAYDACGSTGCGSPAADDHPGDSTLTGSAAINVLAGDSGNDTLTGGDGNDFLFGNGGNDTLNAVDGYADRVSCGDGVDVANVDQFDQVADDCETVNRTVLPSLATEDRQPTIAFTTPAVDGTKMSTSTPNQLAVTASDDRGIVQVVFLAGQRILCIDTTAPYTCAYSPIDADVGRRTLQAVAIDTAQQTATALRDVTVGRFTPQSISASTTPKRDAHTPFHFTTRGRLNLPSRVSTALGCNGKVIVTFKAGTKTVSTRHATLSKSCTYRSSVTFHIPSRLHPSRLRVFVSFRGNAVLTVRRHPTYSVRVR